MPVAFWLTIVVNMAVGWAVAYVVLRHAAPSLFDPSRRNLKGQNVGEGYAAALGGVSPFPAVLIWVRALRKRGYRVGWPPRGSGNR